MFKFKLLPSIFIILFVGISLPIFITSYLSIQQRLNQVRSENELKVKTIGSMLQPVAAEALWYLSPDMLSNVVEMTFTNSYFVEITILDKNYKYFHGIQDVSRFTEQDQVLSFPVLGRGGEKLGRVDLRFNDSTLNAIIRSEVKMGLLRAMTEIFLSLFFVALLLQGRILRRLRVLQKEAEKMAKQDFSTSVYWDNYDEIGEVGAYLDESKRSLQNAFKSLEEKNRQLEELNADLERRVDEKSVQLIQTAKLTTIGEMSAGIAHEINNPLTVVKSNAELILRNIQKHYASDVKLESLAQAIARNASHIAKTVSSLKGFSRDDTLEEVKDVALPEITQDAVELLGPRLKLGVGVLIDDSVRDIMVSCRRTELTQVLVNLLSNAIDAQANLENSWVRVSAERFQAQVKIMVTDSGSGIPPEIHENIFKPFFTTKEEGKGTGLGLSISIQIIERYGGKLYVNREHMNTQFVIELKGP